MTETSIGMIAAGNVAALSVACALYQLGGRDGGPGKSLRRFVASFVIAVAINVTAFLFGKWSPLLLLVYPFKIAEYHLGYGGSTVIQRCVKRFLIVAISCLTGLLLIYILKGGFLIFVIQVIVGLMTVFFGWKNPIHAAAEEVMVCFINSGILLFYPFIM